MDIGSCLSAQAHWTGDMCVHGIDNIFTMNRTFVAQNTNGGIVAWGRRASEIVGYENYERHSIVTLIKLKVVRQRWCCRPHRIRQGFAWGEIVESRFDEINVENVQYRSHQR